MTPISPRAKVAWWVLEHATGPLQLEEVAARCNDMTLPERLNAIDAYDLAHPEDEFPAVIA